MEVTSKGVDATIGLAQTVLPDSAVPTPPDRGPPTPLRIPELDAPNNGQVNDDDGNPGVHESSAQGVRPPACLSGQEGICSAVVRSSNLTLLRSTSTTWSIGRPGPLVCAAISGPRGFYHMVISAGVLPSVSHASSLIAFWCQCSGTRPRRGCSRDDPD